MLQYFKAALKISRNILGKEHPTWLSVAFEVQYTLKCLLFPFKNSNLFMAY